MKCGNCNSPGRWTTSHYTDEHVPRNKLQSNTNVANLTTDKEESTDQLQNADSDKKVSWGDALAQVANRK